MSGKGDRYGSMTDQPLGIGTSGRMFAYKVHRYSGSLLFDIIRMRNTRGASSRKVGVP